MVIQLYTGGERNVKFSEQFMLKFMNVEFKDISDKNWLSTLYYYMIDSKYRVTKRLDLFLKEQLDNPHPELITVAKELKSTAKDMDDLIIKILKYVVGRVRYVTDQAQYYVAEKWVNAYTTWKNKQDDCDGINNLIYILARLAGISQAVLWTTIGDTVSGGHYWLLYFSPKTAKWYSIDGTYYPDFISIKSRQEFKLSKDRYVGIWYMFNEEIILKQK